MKVVDVIFALICGRVVGWIASDFLKAYGINVGFWAWFLPWILAIAALAGLWVASIIGKRAPVVHQAAKFFLVGAFAAVVDIKMYQLFLWLFSLMAFILPIISKAISFLVSTLVKYWGNKHWAFETIGADRIHSELLRFFLVTLIGLALDVSTFYYFTRVLGVQFGMPVKAWQDLSIIFAALAAAIWNFLGYKFLVFKK